MGEAKEQSHQNVQYSKAQAEYFFAGKTMVMCFFIYFSQVWKKCLEKLDKKEEKLWCFFSWFAFFTLGKDQRFVLNKISLPRYDFSGNSTYVDVKDPFMPLACHDDWAIVCTNC